MAKRFNFRLEAVMKLRKQKEDENKRAVAQRVREMSKLQDHLMTLNEQIASEIRKARENAVHTHLDTSDLSKRRFWISHLQRGVLETEFRMRNLEKQLTADRTVLAEASKEYKVIETLRDKRLQAHNREQERLETIEADEMAVNRFVRRQSENAE
ncbi:MAG: flagellar export protein FliJ [Planctomycetota bacterium]|nr:flagellar export protein FliJ [Planctomycetota bacterium]